MTDTSTELPSDYAALFDLIDATPPAERPALRQRFIDQAVANDIDKDIAADRFDSVDTDVCYSDHVIHLRRELGTTLDAADQALRDLDRALRDLVDVYDVEYAEGSGDMRSFVDDAARALRAARALNPCPVKD